MGSQRPFIRGKGNLAKTELTFHNASIVHKASLLKEKDRQAFGIQERLVRDAEADKERREKEELDVVRNKIRATLWLAGEAVALRKFHSLLDMMVESGSKFCETSGEGAYHASENSCWQFIESADMVINRQDTSLIRNSVAFSLVVDTTTDGLEWLAVLARVIDS